MKRQCAVFLFRCCLIALTACASAGASDNDGNGGNGAVARNGRALDVYLCSELQHSGGGNGGYRKMVYTYIDGQKTECMTPQEFSRRFCAVEMLPPPPEQRYALRTIQRRDYTGRDFSEHDMYGMDLRHALLRNANFFRADMRKINLRNADCRGASFEGALVKGGDLSGADLTNANLKGAYFVSCDLSGARGLELETLMRAHCIYNCRLDDDVYELLVRYCPNKFRDASTNWGIEEMQRRLGER